jgi:hypothetical protein
LAVLADDGEKFGGWPGTAKWVWTDGWLESFLDEMERLSEADVVRLTRPSDALREVPSGGLAYLPTASYREMEHWSLPPGASERLDRAEAELVGRPELSSALRGGHWRNFLARYEESNRMHKKAQILSSRCRAAGEPAEARRAIGRAQCNDAYWHGVFGGLYLRHLRQAIWENLARAEGLLRSGEGLQAEWLDLDGDGRPELWVHSSRFSAVVSPARGGCLTELTHFEAGVNLVDVLTRRRESYHRTSRAEQVAGARSETGAVLEASSFSHTPPTADAMPSIHELEGVVRLDTLPPIDLDVRALLVDRVLGSALDPASYAVAEYAPIQSWSRSAFRAEVTTVRDGIEVALESSEVGRLAKKIRFAESGRVVVSYRWDPGGFPENARFAPELSLSMDPGIEWQPEPGDVWRYPITTVSQRESGLEESAQGESITPLWPMGLGAARLVIPPPPYPPV